MKHHVCAFRHRVMLLMVAAVVLVPWPTFRPQQQAAIVSTRIAAGQGLRLSPRLLAEGDKAAVEEFLRFEATLCGLVWGDRCAGRGHGRLGRYNALLPVFSDVEKSKELKRIGLHVAASPIAFPSCQHAGSKKPGSFRQRSWCNNFIPSKPQDQQACATCVSHTVATALQMAVAATLGESPDDWEVNAASLYYCSGRRTRSCNTGYNIEKNLQEVVDQAPELIRPSSCLQTVRELLETAQESSVPSWQAVCDRAKQPATGCEGTNTTPWLNCTYKPLTGFWEIQQHIRNHGAVISRITIYDDFGVQFGPGARRTKGEKLRPYQYNATAKPLYGHTALIVGYDNNEYTWTMLNSWGSGMDDTNSRTGGVTADGLFKISMGLAGVGVPNATYGLMCAPQPGLSWASKHDPLQLRHMYGYKPQKKVSFLNPPVDRQNPAEVQCLKYKVATNDTLSSIVDSFGVDMQSFVEDQLALPAALHSARWGYQNVSFSLRALTNPSVPGIAELGKILNSTSQVFGPGSAFQPFIQCWSYNDKGHIASTTCDVKSGAAACVKLKAGFQVVGCNLHFSVVNVSSRLPVQSVVQVCNITYPNFISHEDSQPWALQQLGINQTCSSTCDGYNGGLFVGCDNQGYVTYMFHKCFGPHMPDELTQEAAYGDASSLYLHHALTFDSFSPGILHALMMLQRMEGFHIHVQRGTMPVQLVRLTSLKHMYLSYSCMHGSLPLIWNWSRLSTLSIRQGGTAGVLNFTDPEGCYVSGNLPAQWPAQMPNYKHLLLENNALVGPLPPEYAYSNNSDTVMLANNQLTGPIPDVYKNWNVHWLDLSRNRLSGILPLFGEVDNAAPTTLQLNLERLYLNGNNFTGELPSSWPRFLNLVYLSIANNKLVGTVPFEWYAFHDTKLEKIDMTDNPGMFGCFPHQAGSINVTSRLEILTLGTGITGYCQQVVNATRDVVAPGGL